MSEQSEQATVPSTSLLGEVIKKVPGVVGRIVEYLRYETEFSQDQGRLELDESKDPMTVAPLNDQNVF